MDKWSPHFPKYAEHRAIFHTVIKGV